MEILARIIVSYSHGPVLAWRNMGGTLLCCHMRYHQMPALFIKCVNLVLIYWIILYVKIVLDPRRDFKYLTYVSIECCRKLEYRLFELIVLGNRKILQEIHIDFFNLLGSGICQIEECTLSSNISYSFSYSRMNNIRLASFNFSNISYSFSYSKKI